MSINSIITATIAYGALAATSGAVGIFGIGVDNSLYSFDSATPGSFTQIGASGSASNLVDLDFHAVNGLLYGVSSTGQAFTINTVTGSQSLVTTPITGLSGITAIDFNPAADRIRLIGTGNSTARLTPNAQSAPTPTQANGTVTPDGTLIFALSDGTTPRTGITVLGAGYTNPTDNPVGTTLFTIGSDGFLNTHVTPVGDPVGTFRQGNAVGTAGLGFIPVGSGFDILENGVNDLGYAFDGDNLRLIDLALGTSSIVPGGPVAVDLRALAVVPEPSALLLSGLAGLGLLRRRRN